MQSQPIIEIGKFESRAYFSCLLLEIARFTGHCSESDILGGACTHFNGITKV